MKVKVKYHGVIKDITKAAIAEFEIPDDATVSDLLGHMRERYGQEFEDRVLDDRMGVQTFVLLFLNDQEVDHGALKTTRLSTAGKSALATLYVLPGSTGGASESSEFRVSGSGLMVAPLYDRSSTRNSEPGTRNCTCRHL